MAKRKRLTPTSPETTSGVAPETKSGFPSYPKGVTPGSSAPPSSRRAPIADVVGVAAATSALSEISAELEAARNEGRMVQSLPLDAVNAGHLVRDRLVDVVADDDMQSLIGSLRARGQQTPIEVVGTGQDTFGLISGWRRLNALRYLYAETGEARFATVGALVRRPETAADAYVAMVEENEIRSGLSYYERAQIVSHTVADGIYPDQKKALNALFGSTSRARRSKIKSFVPLVEELRDVLGFPTAITERLGLKLSSRLGKSGFTEALKDRLIREAPATAEAELALLALVVSGPAQGAGPPRPDSHDKTGNKGNGRSGIWYDQKGEQVAPGIWLLRDASGLHVAGPGLTDEIEAKLRAILVK